MKKRFKIYLIALIIISIFYLKLINIPEYRARKYMIDFEENKDYLYNVCFFLSLQSVLKSYNNNLKFNETLELCNINNNDYIATGYNELLFNEEIKNKNLKFYFLPDNKIEDFLLKKIPIFLTTINKDSIYLNKHSILLIDYNSKKHKYLLFDPSLYYETVSDYNFVENKKDKLYNLIPFFNIRSYFFERNLDSKYLKWVNNSDILNLLKIQPATVLVNSNKNIINNEIVELTDKYTKFYKELSLYPNDNYKKLNFSNIKLSEIDLFYLKLKKSENKKAKDILKLYSNYRIKNKEVVTYIDFLVFELLIKNNKLNQALKISDNLFSKKYSTEDIFNPLSRMHFFYTASICSLLNESNKIKIYEKNVFSPFNKLKKAVGNLEDWQEILEKNENDPFFKVLDKIGLSSKNFKQYNSLEEIIDNYFLTWKTLYSNKNTSYNNLIKDIYYIRRFNEISK